MTDSSLTENFSHITNPKNEKSKISLNSNQKIKISKIKEIIRSHFQSLNYNKNDEFELNDLKEFTDVIKNKLKDLKLNRYKIIVQSFLGDQKNQGINLVNKCLFDPKNDHCITEQYFNNNIFCFIVVYLIYVY